MGLILTGLSVPSTSLLLQRPSEISNLRSENIHLDHEVPHIDIVPKFGIGEAREIKTQSSIRQIPLVGLALKAMGKHPNGFEKYHDRDNTLSAVLL